MIKILILDQSKPISLIFEEEKEIKTPNMVTENKQTNRDTKQPHKPIN